MLTTKPLRPKKDKPGSGGIVAYCQHLKKSADHQAGYYVNKPAPSRWMGSLAAELGYAGLVDAQQLHAALEGRIGLDSGASAGDAGDRGIGQYRRALLWPYRGWLSVGAVDAVKQEQISIRSALNWNLE